MAEIDGNFVFFPTDEQLCDIYLRKYLARAKLADVDPDVPSFFHEVDVYSAFPEQLLADLAPAPGTGDGDRRVWYMFSPVRSLSSRFARKSRVVGTGGNESWHAEGGPKNVEGSAAGGKLQKFSYKIKTASGIVKPGWLMVEYTVPGVDNLALCKVYRSPRATRSTASSSSSSFSTASPVSGSKRKAEEEHPEAPPYSVQRQTPPEEGHDDGVSSAKDVSSCSSSKTMADDGVDHPEAPPSVWPRQTSEPSQSPPDYPESQSLRDLDRFLSEPVEDGVEHDAGKIQETMRYLSGDDDMPAPGAPTREVAGGADEDHLEAPPSVSEQSQPLLDDLELELLHDLDSLLSAPMDINVQHDPGKVEEMMRYLSGDDSIIDC